MRRGIVSRGARHASSMSVPPDDPVPADPDVTAVPETPLATAVLAEVLDAEAPSIAHHSVRSFFFARMLAGHLGATSDSDYDEELLFAACVLHDMGLAPSTGGTQRFEVEGADRAAEFLTQHGLPAPKVDAVWEAVALHTSFGIAERRGLLCRLTREGVGMDFGYGAEFVTDQEGARIHAAYPRLDLEKALVDIVVDQGTRVPTKAPRYSMAAVLVDQRATPPHLTQIELAARTARWTS